MGDYYDYEMANSAENGENWTVEKCLEDVEARFLYNLSEEEFSQADRLFFQIEQAWWFYEDFFADKFEHIPHFKKLVNFAELIFRHCPLLKSLQHKFAELFTEFGIYKNQIPVCGCILLNPSMTKVLLVCTWNGNSWSFPRGKINEGEAPMACAVRETFEETGFDATAYCKSDDFLVHVEKENGKVIQLYVAPNVPEDFVFAPHCRKEVSKVEFHPIDNLPKSYAVLPFLPKLKRWINTHKRSSRRSTSRSNNNNNVSGASASDTRSTPSRRDRRASPMSGSRSNLTTQFDSRNSDTFTEDISAGTKGWTVNDMFAANAKLTGRQFSYSGNPHEFGASHPRFIDYRQQQQATSSSSSSSSSSSMTPGTVAIAVRGSESVSLLVPAETTTKSYFPCPFVFDTVDIMAAVDQQLKLSKV